MSESEIPTTMLAWRKHLGTLEPVQEEVPVPKAPSDGFLVKVLAAGVCHSDVSLVRREDPPEYYNNKYTLGHEGCGEIIRIGPQMKDSSFKLGDTIALLPIPGCGEDSCLECSVGSPQVCYRCRCLGIGHDGSFAPYVAVPYRAAVPVPKGVTPGEAATATDAVMTAYHAVTKVAAVKPTETVLIYGLGGLGFNALQIALFVGATVLVADRREQTLVEAAKFGVAQENIIPVGKDPSSFVKEGGFVVDTVIDFVGAKETFVASQHIVRTLGKIVVVGLLETDLPVTSLLCCRKKLSILFSYGGTYQDIVECLQLIQKGFIKPQVELGKLDDFPEILKTLDEGKIKCRIALIPTHD